MNYPEHKPADLQVIYQRDRFRDLMEEIVDCCQARNSYLSQKFGVPMAELRCLLLFRNERYLTPKDIATQLEVARSRVTRILDGLVAKSLVERIPDPKDGRYKLVRLTKRGQEQCEMIFDFNNDLHLRLLSSLDPGERREVLGSLEILRSAMEGIKKELV